VDQLLWVGRFACIILKSCRIEFQLDTASPKDFQNLLRILVQDVVRESDNSQSLRFQILLPNVILFILLEVRLAIVNSLYGVERAREDRATFFDSDAARTAVLAHRP